jgi:thymidylate synthase (FAD)
MTKQIEIVDNENYIPILDHGFVGLVDWMGSDSSICQAARVSYGDGTKSVNEDRGLIRYMMNHGHTSPFEMIELKFHLKIPIVVMRQHVRHRTASLNEYSGRYSEMTDEMYLPAPDRMQKQSQTNKQGSSEEELSNQQKAFVESLMSQSYQTAYKIYEYLLGYGMSRELSRIVLPVANYTELYWKIDLKNFFHYIKLRSDPHAQYEIRVVADAMYDLIKPIFPIACEAFEDYWMNAKTLNAMEQTILKQFLSFVQDDVKNEFMKYVNGNGQLSKREIQEFLTKLGIDKLF